MNRNFTLVVITSLLVWMIVALAIFDPKALDSCQPAATPTPQHQGR